MTDREPKLDVYLVRHGRSESNATSNTILGRCESSPLVSSGVDQARRVGVSLSKAGLLPAAVYSSPTVRARSTADLALQAAGLTGSGAEVVEEAALHEQDVGAWFGRVASLTFDDEVLAQIARSGKDFRPPGGESMNDVATRMLEWLDSLTVPFPPPGPGPVLAFTHGGAVRALVSRLRGWTHAQTYATKPSNCSVTLVSSGADRMWRCEFLALTADEAFTRRTAERSIP
ncbi:histidine phosphatase family protein [Rhodococcoides kyotonense]|uniref:Probable phosphoglycerate mutase n=1 Tax=Rhodococcoides kyotonense TaxID=398843 RepID=A0A239N1C5_9NOCA|nr:histidine phosphatase family protein [Rhodococcus kyotonensis]SNT47949.1 probable phosphoglycerate mutase [Rhodococcus kyotonensis]